jgi:hypothetical protein
MGLVGNAYRSKDLLALKKTLCDELQRIADTIRVLQRRSDQVAPDVPKEDLLEIFSAEYERLFTRHQAIDEMLAMSGGVHALELLEQNRENERKRVALEKNGYLKMVNSGWRFI